MGERDGQQPGQIDHGEVEFSNGVRLTGREWLVVGLFTLLLVAFAPALGNRLEPFPTEPDYRMPHDLSNDYWLWQRWAQQAADQHDTLLLGDSVIWGEYVRRTETLSHYLNEQDGRDRCANLGLDGTHPLALAGLVEHHGGSITGKNVLLQCNPLWLTSRRSDLQDDQASDFNHPRLVPQFLPRIPGYKEEISPRIGVLVERRLPLSLWTTHLQQAYYDRNDIPTWTLEHPYESPLRPLTRGLPPLDNTLRHQPQPWYKSGIVRQDYAWVDPETSLQWPAFQRAVRTLRNRDNRVFVLVGPFNEHLLTPESLKRYEPVKGTMAAWLAAEGIPFAAPPALPSEEYGDASHPLAEGYARLAGELLKHPSWYP